VHLAGPYYANISEQSGYCGRCSFLTLDQENEGLFYVKIGILNLQHSTVNSMTVTVQCNFRGL
jgi:hypothetical protein